MSWRTSSKKLTRPLQFCLGIVVGDPCDEDVAVDGSAVDVGFLVGVGVAVGFRVGVAVGVDAGVTVGVGVGVSTVAFSSIACWKVTISMSRFFAILMAVRMRSASKLL